MDNPSNKLLDRLSFKSLVIPSWFGASVEDWVSLQDIFGDFFAETLVPQVVQKLLDIENSPDYWVNCKVWPYPDSSYFKEICAILDTKAPEYWGLEVRMFWFAYMIQHLRMATHSLLYEVYRINLQKQ